MAGRLEQDGTDPPTENKESQSDEEDWANLAVDRVLPRVFLVYLCLVVRHLLCDFGVVIHDLLDIVGVGTGGLADDGDDGRVVEGD